jgi:hypothetical protein
VTVAYDGTRAKSELLNIDFLPKSLTFLQVVNFLETKDVPLFKKDTFPRLEALDFAQD